MSCNVMKVRYSEINHSETWANNAKDCLFFLLKNGYVKISAYFEIEANKIMKCLKVLGLKHNINFIEPQNQNFQGEYEITLDFFKDDRVK